MSNVLNKNITIKSPGILQEVVSAFVEALMSTINVIRLSRDFTPIWMAASSISIFAVDSFHYQDKAPTV